MTANTLRHPRSGPAGVAAFFAGALYGEMAPQVLALHGLDTANHLRHSPRSKAGLALAAVNAAGLAYVVRQSQRAKDVLEEALVDGLGVDYVEQLDAPPTPSDLATPWKQLARPFNFRTEGIRRLRNIVYTDGPRGMLDIFLPDGEDAVAKAPVLLQVHGGGWTVGQKEHQAMPLMTRMAAKGWICVAINYRLAPHNRWPAHIIDVKKSIAWIKENIAEYGGDPDYIVVTGGSAGGHLAALAALTPGAEDFQPGFEDADTSVQAAVPFYGVYDFAGATGLKNAVRVRDTFFSNRLMEKPWSEAPESFEAASPILQITPDAPDFFVLHGELDSLASVEEARLFVAGLRRVSKKSVVYGELPGAQHAFDIFHSIRAAHVVRAVDRYLTWHWHTWRKGVAADDEAAVEQTQD